MPDLLEVARAALLEVGENPRSVQWSPTRPGAIRFWGDVAGKAAYLAHMSLEGPEALVRCHRCAHDATRERCTPVRDAIRGITCGR